MEKSIFSTYTKNKTTKSFSNFLSKIMLYMSIGLGISTLAAFLFLNTPLANLIFIINNKSIIGIKSSFTLVMYSPLIIYFLYTFLIDNKSYKLEMIFFTIYSFLIGISLSSLFLIYTSDSILTTFLTTIIGFLSMSLYAQKTSTNLLQYSGLLKMFLIGFIISGIFNALLFHSSFYYFIESLIGLPLFCFLIAYQIQGIKSAYYAGHTNSYTQVKMAFSLYLSFINLFLHLIRLLGNKRK